MPAFLNITASICGLKYRCFAFCGPPAQIGSAEGNDVKNTGWPVWESGNNSKNSFLGKLNDLRPPGLHRRGECTLKISLRSADTEKSPDCPLNYAHDTFWVRTISLNCVLAFPASRCSTCLYYSSSLTLVQWTFTAANTLFIHFTV